MVRKSLTRERIPPGSSRSTHLRKAMPVGMSSGEADLDVSHVWTAVTNAGCGNGARNGLAGW